MSTNPAEPSAPPPLAGFVLSSLVSRSLTVGTGGGEGTLRRPLAFGMSRGGEGTLSLRLFLCTGVKLHMFENAQRDNEFHQMLLVIFTLTSGGAATSSVAISPSSWSLFPCIVI